MRRQSLSDQPKATARACSWGQMLLIRRTTASNITAPIADDTISAAMPAPKWTPILENSQRATYDLQMHGRYDNLIA